MKIEIDTIWNHNWPFVDFSFIDQLNFLLEISGNCNKILNQIFACSITLGIFPVHSDFSSRLLRAYAKLNKIVQARKVYDQIPKPDARSSTYLLNVYLHDKKPTKALLLFSKLIVSGLLKPDSGSIVACLSACARTKDISSGKIIHGMVYKFLKRPRPSVQNALIDFYGKNRSMELAERVFRSTCVKDVAIWTSLLNGFLLNGDIESANGVFDDMPQRNVVSWTAMIVGFVRKKNPVGALELFQKMRNEDVGVHCDPTTFTIVAVLSGCADIGAFNLGSAIHGYVNKRSGFVVDATVNNGLIDMYGKSGNLDLAAKIFYGMRTRDLFSWTSMISALALHGSGNYALLVFDSMVESGMNPNEVTFLSVLSACSHAGLVTEGEKVFDKIVNIYNLKPSIEHFGCMVDLYVRAGFVEKAMQLVEWMPMKPDAVIWRSLLSACLGNGNLELAEVAGKKVLELEPGNDAVYVLLLRVYRSRNKWEDALKSIKIMRNQRIKKTPGCSWIEVNGIVHEFLAEASRDHICDGILVLMDGLIGQSKIDSNLFFS